MEFRLLLWIRFIWNKIMFSLQREREHNTSRILGEFKEEFESNLNLNDNKSLELCRNLDGEALKVWVHINIWNVLIDW